MRYIFILIIISMLLYSCKDADASPSKDNKFYFNPTNAYNYIKKQVDVGARVYGSEAHKNARPKNK